MFCNDVACCMSQRLIKGTQIPLYVNSIITLCFTLLHSPTLCYTLLLRKHELKTLGWACFLNRYSKIHQNQSFSLWSLSCILKIDHAKKENLDLYVYPNAQFWAIVQNYSEILRWHSTFYVASEWNTMITLR